MSKPAWAEDIARERIDILFAEASAAFPAHPERADRYVELARRIAMRFNLSLPEKHRKSICSSCYAYLEPGVNARVRVEGGEKRITCEECGAVERRPYRDEE